MRTLEINKRQIPYTETQGFDDSLKRTGAIITPMLIALVIPLFYSIFYVFQSLSNIPKGNPLTQVQLFFYYISPGIGMAMLAIVVSFMSIKLVSKNAETFLRDFYALPDSVNTRDLTGLRIFGRAPMPSLLSKMGKFPLLKVKDGKIGEEENWQSIIGGPTKLQIEPGNAVYLERGSQFSRVVGQGSAFIEHNERIKAVVNVGPQSKTFDLTAWTKDGIRIKLHAKGEYFLGSLERTPQNENVLIPFDAEAVQQAVEATLKGGKEGHEWIEGAVGKTKGILNSYIADKELEAIFTNETRLFTKQSIDTLLAKINDGLKASGVCLSYFQITDALTNPKITDQRLDALDSAHKGYMTLVKGENNAQNIREQERGYAEMQRDLIYTLANGLERIDAANARKMLETVYRLLDQNVSYPWRGSSTDGEISETGEEE